MNDHNPVNHASDGTGSAQVADGSCAVASRPTGLKVQFYHLTTTPLERALPKVLEKAYAGGFKTLLVAESEQQVDRLNELLWTYDPASFLPHGSAKDEHAENQPILLASDVTLANNANLLFVTGGTYPESPERFERILDMFDGNDAQAVERARTRWTTYKSAGISLSYLKQTPSGGWEQKAVA